MDYSNSGKKSPLFVSGNDVCKLKAQQKMNEIVKPISNMEASIKKKKKKTHHDSLLKEINVAAPCSYQTVENKSGKCLIRWRVNISEAKY